MEIVSCDCPPVALKVKDYWHARSILYKRVLWFIITHHIIIMRETAPLQSPSKKSESTHLPHLSHFSPVAKRGLVFIWRRRCWGGGWGGERKRESSCSHFFWRGKLQGGAGSPARDRAGPWGCSRILAGGQRWSPQLAVELQASGYNSSQLSLDPRETEVRGGMQLLLPASVSGYFFSRNPERQKLVIVKRPLLDDN